MNRPQKLIELSSTVYYNMDKYHQIIHDIVEEAEAVYVHSETEDEVKEAKGAVSYDIGVLMEVISPEHENDIFVLKELTKILN